MTKININIKVDIKSRRGERVVEREGELKEARVKWDEWLRMSC